jgi:hypothetical protein
LHNKARRFPESIFEDEPRPARKANLQIRMSGDVLNEFDQLLMLSIEFIQSFNEEEELSFLDCLCSRYLEALVKL